jgi:hypothetical protein
VSFELVNTSVPKGLKPGSRGFASVAFTEGMPANYVQLCETLSAYVHVFGPQDPRYAHNPVGYSHLLAVSGGRAFSILSRVAAYGTDYTGRTNKLAHHVLLESRERPACGPAVAMDDGRIFLREWKDPPRFLPVDRVQLPDVARGMLKAVAWERVIGDAGVAGKLAQSFLDAPDRPSFIIFAPGMDLLPLLAEAQALLPAERSWELTFSTYFTALPVGMKCAWRCCLAGSEALVAARRTANALIIDLTARSVNGTALSDEVLVASARTGIRGASASPVAAKAPPPVHAPGPQVPKGSRVAIGPTADDYDRALRPAVPKRAQQSLRIAPLVAAGVLVLLIVAAIAYFLAARGRGAAGEVPAAQAARPPIDVLPHPTAAESSSQPDAPNAGLVGPTVDSTQETETSSPQLTPASADTQDAVGVMPANYAFGNSLDVASPLKVIFYGPDGLKIESNLGPNQGEGIPYKRIGKADLQDLARHNGDKLIISDPAHIGVVEIRSSKSLDVLFVSPLNGEHRVVSGQEGEFEIRFPDSDGVRLMMEMLKAKGADASISACDKSLPASLAMSQGAMVVKVKNAVDWKGLIGPAIQERDRVEQRGNELGVLGEKYTNINKCISAVRKKIQEDERAKPELAKTMTQVRVEAEMNRRMTNSVGEIEVIMKKTEVLIASLGNDRRLGSAPRDQFEMLRRGLDWVNSSGKTAKVKLQNAEKSLGDLEATISAIDNYLERTNGVLGEDQARAESEIRAKTMSMERARLAIRVQGVVVVEAVPR